MYTEMFNFRPQSWKEASKPKPHWWLGKRLPLGCHPLDNSLNPILQMLFDIRVYTCGRLKGTHAPQGISNRLIRSCWKVIHISNSDLISNPNSIIKFQIMRALKNYSRKLWFSPEWRIERFDFWVSTCSTRKIILRVLRGPEVQNENSYLT